MIFNLSEFHSENLTELSFFSFPPQRLIVGLWFVAVGT